MQRDSLKALLGELGLNAGKNTGRFKDSGANVQFCCPWHGERRPSAGIHVDDEFGRCFACGETFTLTKLVAYCMDWVNTFKDKDGKTHEFYDYARAEDWLEEKYNVEKRIISKESLGLRRIEDVEEEEEKSTGRFEMPRVKIAPFKSGKATHDYYFDRGFDEEDVKTFMVGWDAMKLRVTFPAFWEDMTLCGIMGRAVIPQKIKGKDNPEFYAVYKGKNALRYLIYDNFPVGDILYPMWLFKPKRIGKKRKRAILVEGFLDAQWMHKYDYPETLSSVNAKLTYDKRKDECKQRDILLRHGVTDVILMRDNDEAGKTGNEHDYKILKDHFNVLSVKYPKRKNDPQSLTKKEIDLMIEGARPYRLRNSKKLRRI